MVVARVVAREVVREVVLYLLPLVWWFVVLPAFPLLNLILFIKTRMIRNMTTHSPGAIAISSLNISAARSGWRAFARPVAAAGLWGLINVKLPPLLPPWSGVAVVVSCGWYTYVGSR